VNEQLRNHDPWRLMAGRKRLGELIADAQDGIGQERMRLGWMAGTGSHADLAKQVRTVAALEARLIVLREVLAIFTGG
jgi:hypothetical protein